MLLDIHLALEGGLDEFALGKGQAGDANMPQYVRFGVVRLDRQTGGHTIGTHL